jgi:MATE family multidrug resistance protein
VKQYLPFYKRNITLAIPIILSQLGQIIVQQVDIMMVGYLGTAELAASAFANSVFMIGLIIIIGFSMGLTPLVGHQLSNKNSKNLKKILSNAYAINILFAVILSFVLYMVSYLFNYMGQEAQIVSLSTNYYYTLVLSVVPLTIFLTNKQFAEGIGDTKNAMYVTIISNLINIVLNYVLIFGHFGAPKLGLYGAGIATLISRVFMFVAFILIYRYNNTFKPYFTLIKWSYINKVWFKKIFSMGAPISMQLLLEVSAFAISAIMAGWLGSIALAAHQIALGLATISFMIVGGIGSATTIRVAHQNGNKDITQMVMASKASIHLVLSFMGLAAISFILMRNFLPTLYTLDKEVIELTSMLLIIVGIFQVFDGLQVVMLSILRGIGDVKHAMIYALIAYIFINIPLGYFLGFKLGMGLSGIWTAIIIGLASAGLMFYFRFRKILKESYNI